MESGLGSPKGMQCSTVSSDWFTIKKMGVTKGRLIAPQEYTLGIPVVVIGQDVADRISFESSNPLGAVLRIQSIPYTVVGVADKQEKRIRVLARQVRSSRRKSSPLNRWVNPHGVIDAMIVQAPGQRRRHK